MLFIRHIQIVLSAFALAADYMIQNATWKYK